MANKPIVIIHGWSDSAKGMRRLARLLQKNLNRSIHQIHLADYITLDDDVTMNDIVAAMDKAWWEAKLSRKPYSVDVVVHSTGGLVIRDWMSQFFTPKTVPIKNLVMLAPANFGSPLAHKGRALIGRVLRGFSGDKWFETGTHVLKALELASTYSWDLAMRDRFGRENFYGPGKVLCTVLVGNHGNEGLAAAANDPGTDGVVRLSTANLNCAFLELDFTREKELIFRIKQSSGQTAFAILEGENHTTISCHEGGPKNPWTLPAICSGLQVNDKNFKDWMRTCTTKTKAINLGKGLNEFYYQNTVIHVCNQYGHCVPEYFIEFFDKEEKWVSELFHGNIIETVHAYQDNNSYRSLLVNCTLIEKSLQAHIQQIQMSLSALPNINKGELAGYQTIDKLHFPGLALTRDKIHKLFMANRTLFIRIKIPRLQSSKLFQIRKR